MDWWKEIVLALIAAAPPTTVAWIGWRSGSAGRKVIGAQVNEVSQTVNGQRDAMMSEVSDLKAEARELKEEIRELKLEVKELKRLASSK